MNWFLVNAHLEGYLASVTSDDLYWENEDHFSFNLLHTYKELPEVLQSFITDKVDCMSESSLCSLH